MDSEGRDLLCDTLNSTPLYVATARACRAREIGVIVLSETGRETARYVSLNNSAGYVETIEQGFNINSPDVTVKVKDQTLIDILHEIEYLQDNPLHAFTKYVTDFRPARPIKDSIQLVKIARNFASNLYSLSKAYLEQRAT